MRLPGFTAEVAVRGYRGKYAGAAVNTADAEGSVHPQIVISRLEECLDAGGNFWECLYWDWFLRNP